MSDNPTDHELNEVLARVAGVEVNYEHPGSPTWFIYEDGTDEDNNDEPYIIKTIWNPINYASQMEKVKAGLRERCIVHASEWAVLDEGYKCQVWNGSNHDFYGTDKSELRAFALAVYAMSQERDGHVPSH